MKITIREYASGNWTKKRAVTFEARRGQRRRSQDSAADQSIGSGDTITLTIGRREFTRLVPAMPVIHTSKAVRERYGT